MRPLQLAILVLLSLSACTRSKPLEPPPPPTPTAQPAQPPILERVNRDTGAAEQQMEDKAKAIEKAAGE